MHHFKKLNKRTLEILDLKTRPQPIEKRLEDAQIDQKKEWKNKSRAPVYFFQPHSSKGVKQKSDGRQDLYQDSNPIALQRDRSKSEQLTQLIRGCQKIIQYGEVECNSQDHPNSQKKHSQMFQTPTRNLEQKFKPTQKPISQDPHQLKTNLSEDFYDLKIFQTQSSDYNFNQKREFGRNKKAKKNFIAHPLTPDNTPNSSQYQAFKSPVLQQQRSQKIIRPFLQKQSRSSDVPFQADSKMGSENSRQKDEIEQQQKIEYENQKEQEEITSLRGIKSSLLAVKHQKQLLMSDPTEFNILIAGQSGIGKTTFIKQFLHKFSKGKFQIQQTLDQDSYINRKAANGTKTIQFKEYSVDRLQSDLKLKITMIDSPGYGNSSNIEDWIQRIKNQLKHRMIQYRDEKNQIQKSKQKQMIKFMMMQPKDCRVHCCLYFINGHHTKSCDMVSMRQISKYTNIIPVLSKADSFTTDELIEAKCNIIHDASQAKIKFFDCIEAIKIIEYEQPGSIIESKLGPCPPFCVIGATDYIKHLNRKSQERLHKAQKNSDTRQIVAGRQYPWGFCDAENVNHSDFLILYQALINYLCIPCIKTTQNYHRKFINQVKIQRNNQNQSFQNIKSAAKYTLFGMAFGAASFLISKFK